MAVKASVTRHDELVHLDLYPEEQRVRSTDDPTVAGYVPSGYIWFYWDDEKLDVGERAFLGVEVNNITRLAEEDLHALDRVAPRINLAELGLVDVTVSDVLRQIRSAYLRERARATA